MCIVVKPASQPAMFVAALACVAWTADPLPAPPSAAAQGGTLVLAGTMSAGALVSFMLFQQSLSSAFQVGEAMHARQDAQPQVGWHCTKGRQHILQVEGQHVQARPPA